MRVALLAPLLVASALAQNSSAVNVTALTGLASALSQAGLTDLATLAAAIANTTAGNTLLGAITDTSKNYTLLAPSNDALSKVPKNATPDDLAVILSYHVLPGGFENASFFANAPNHSVIRTFLNDSNSVSLEGNQSQVLVFESVNNKTITILNQNPTANVTNATQFGNYTILTIDSVLTPPGSIASLLKSSDFSSLSQALDLANLTAALESAHGFTLFAPTNAAFQSAQSKLGANATNATIVAAIINNHIINGTSIYSTEFGNKLTSAGGEGLNFSQTNGTWEVSSGGNATFSAHITEADILVSNGVVHVIDNVLANDANDTNAASSAFSSATSAAASSTANGAVGTTPAGAPSATTGAAVALVARPVGVQAILVALVAIAFGACLL